jgi:mono/diheme cytochrome c family protein
MLFVGLVASSLAVAATQAQNSTGGTNEWVAPARAAKKKNPIEVNEVSLTKGKAVYVKECASCHGDKGKGDGPAVKDLERKPGDMTSAKTQEQSDGALFWKITEGNKPMASYDKTLSEEDRWHVINYLRTFSPKPSK